MLAIIMSVWSDWNTTDCWVIWHLSAIVPHLLYLFACVVWFDFSFEDSQVIENYCLGLYKIHIAFLGTGRNIFLYISLIILTVNLSFWQNILVLGQNVVYSWVYYLGTQGQNVQRKEIASALNINKVIFHIISETIHW